MEPKFYNKNGTLTKYALFCGYVEKKKTVNQWEELYIEHNCIHVRAGIQGEQYNVWESFESSQLFQARKFYNSIKLN